MKYKNKKKIKRGKSLFLIWIEYFPVMCLWHIIHLMPLGVKVAFGKSLGWVTYLLLKNYREVVRCNLKVAFPDIDTQEQNRLIKQSFIHFGRVIMEFIALYKISKKEFVKRCIIDKSSVEVLKTIYQKAQKDNKGAILYCSHLGTYYWNFYFLNLFLNDPNLWHQDIKSKISNNEIKKGYVSVRKLDNPLINKKMTKLFAKINTLAIERGSSFFKISNLIQTTATTTFIMVDQNCSRGNFYAPFFKKEASTMSGPFHLYHKTKADSYFISNYWKNDKVHFKVEPISKAHKTPVSFFKEINSYAEKAITKNPEQYLWLHPRWKKQASQKEYIYGKLKV